jgi:hypothetical protein
VDAVGVGFGVLLDRCHRSHVLFVKALDDQWSQGVQEDRHRDDQKEPPGDTGPSVFGSKE